MKRNRVWILEIFWFATLIFCLHNLVMANGPPPGKGKGPSLSVDPSDILLIKGILDGENNSFSGRVRLTVTGGDTNVSHPVGFWSSDLEHTGDSKVVIEGTHVKISEGIALSNGIPLPVVVTVENVKRPGKYKGKLHFLLEQHQVEAPIDISLNIGAKPEVEALYDSNMFQIINSRYNNDNNPVISFLVSWLVGQQMLREDWPLDVENLTLLPVEVQGATVVMRGEKSGYSLGVREVRLDSCSLPARQVSQVNLHINREKLEPDRYQGSVRLKLKDCDDPVRIEATIEARNGPFIPLLIVFLGIVVGRLAMAMQSPKKMMQMRLLSRYYTLKGKANKVIDLIAKDKLDKDLQELLQRINRAKETEEALSQDLDKIEEKIDLMITLDELQKKVAALPASAIKDILLNELAEARIDILDDEIEEGIGHIDNVKAQLPKVLNRTFYSDDLSRLYVGLGDLKKIIPKIKTREKIKWWHRALPWISGGPLISLELWYWLVRPLLFLLLLVLLSFVGFKSLYVDGGSIFGAAGIYDYLGLFLWGLSSDVAQRTLQNVQFSK